MRIFLGLGSNLGDRAANLGRAIELLAPEITVTKKSAVYCTRPMYVKKQPEFLNLAAEASTELSAQDTFKKIKRIESDIGRKESERFGPRIIDIDLLFYGTEQIVEPGLTVPHPRIAERAFVLTPLSDIAPHFVHPTLGVTIAELLQKLGDTSEDVRKIETTL